jgi:hypothetical protein
MASIARKAFDKNAEDINRLLEIHEKLGGTGPGRRLQLEVLNKSAVVLLTSFWEAYCEDIAAEAVAHVAKHAAKPDDLPKELRQLIASELKAEQHELAIWKVAGDGWKGLLGTRLEKLREQRNRQMNAPKADRVDELFLKALGISQLSSEWHWQGMSAAKARKKLDDYVDFRGAIAHRGKGATNCYKWQVEDYFDHVKTIVGKTGGHVNSVVRKATGSPLW